VVKEEFGHGRKQFRCICSNLAQFRHGYYVSPYDVFDFSLTEDVIDVTLEQAQKDHLIIFRFKQDEHGRHQFTYPENVKAADPISLEPGAITQQLFLFDGENAWPMAPAWTSAKPQPKPVIENAEQKTAASRSERRWFGGNR